MHRRKLPPVLHSERTVILAAGHHYLARNLLAPVLALRAPRLVHSARVRSVPTRRVQAEVYLAVDSTNRKRADFHSDKIPVRLRSVVLILEGIRCLGIRRRSQPDSSPIPVLRLPVCSAVVDLERIPDL